MAEFALLQHRRLIFNRLSDTFQGGCFFLTLSGGSDKPPYNTRFEPFRINLDGSICSISDDTVVRSGQRMNSGCTPMAFACA